MKKLIIAVVGALSTLMLPAAAQGSVQPGPTVADYPQYRDWAYVRDARCDYTWRSDCYNTTSVASWRWTSTRWVSASIAVDSLVWVEPYTREYRWVWTRSSGWLAIEGRYLTFSPGSMRW